MKYITDPEHFFDVIIKETYSLFIYSSAKSCPPCRALKKWIETEHPDTPHVYYIDMDKPELESLTTQIYAMPTLQLHHHSTVIDTIEGFNKALIIKALDTLKTNSHPAREPTLVSELVFTKTSHPAREPTLVSELVFTKTSHPEREPTLVSELVFTETSYPALEPTLVSDLVFTEPTLPTSNIMELTGTSVDAILSQLQKNLNTY